MILSRNIPLNVQAFLNRIDQNYQAGLHRTAYRELLIEQTRLRYPGLVEGLADLARGRTRDGELRIVADADHIVPQSCWNILIPLVWNLGTPAPTTPHILGNLFWRTVTLNRGAMSRGEAVDNRSIFCIQAEAATHASRPWAENWMLNFLRTKHDEGVNIDIPLDPGRVDQIGGGGYGGYVGDAIEFILRTRQQRPRIGIAELIRLVEERFPLIRIEMEGNKPVLKLG